MFPAKVKRNWERFSKASVSLLKVLIATLCNPVLVVPKIFAGYPLLFSSFTYFSAFSLEEKQPAIIANFSSEMEGVF